MERLMWEKLKEHFNMEDFFNPKCKMKYSWDNTRRDEIKVLISLIGFIHLKLKETIEKTPLQVT
jgi:hypothetical protein